MRRSALARVAWPPHSWPNMALSELAKTFPHQHLLGIEGLSPGRSASARPVRGLCRAEPRAGQEESLLRGRTIINLFFENSTRTRTSFELAGKRLGGDVINMSAEVSSVKKGETLIDTAMTLNAMLPDVLIVRHPDCGAVELLSEKVKCAVINGGDGSHEHPTQALLDALAIRRRKGAARGPDGRDLRRHPAQPRRPLEHPCC